PEIRYDKTFDNSESLHQIQLSILDAVAPKLKKGGIIIYSTCTILQQENEQTVLAFLKQHPEYCLLKTQTARAIKNDRQKKTLTILPSDFGSDGFFIGTLQRIK
ncbi:MAG: 16S rRNA (cytosine(967)-C(5))-methyltransferase RsmB, partial [Candidatus Limosilactobacillus intestinavium]